MSSKKKDVPEIMRGMGVGLSIMTNFLAELERRQLPDWLLHVLATPRGEPLIRQFVDILKEEIMEEEVKGVYDITIDYDSLSLSKMFGNLEAESRIQRTGVFDVEGEGQNTHLVYLFGFDISLFSKDAEKKIRQKGFRPAKVEEHFALLNRYPELQNCGHSIVALNVSKQCQREGLGYCALFWGCYDKRMELQAGADGSRWTEMCYFAAVSDKG